jgi:hypothetical protein
MYTARERSAAGGIAGRGYGRTLLPPLHLTSSDLHDRRSDVDVTPLRDDRTMSAIIIQFPDRNRDARTTSAVGRTNHVVDRDVVHATFGPDDATDQTDHEWFGQANNVLDCVEAMLADGAAREVTSLCEQALWCVLAAAPEIDDGDCVMALVERLRDMHVRACRVAPPDPLELARFVHRLATSDDVDVDALHGVIDPYLPLLGGAGVDAVRRCIAADEVRLRNATPIMRAILEFRLRPIRAALTRFDHPSSAAATTTQRRDLGRRRGSAS